MLHQKVFEKTHQTFGVDGAMAISETAADNLSICALWYATKQPLTTQSLHMLWRLQHQLHQPIHTQWLMKQNTPGCKSAVILCNEWFQSPHSDFITTSWPLWHTKCHKTTRPL